MEPGDLLFNRTNSAELVGKSAVFGAHEAPCSFASYLIRVRFGGGIGPEFVACFLNSPAGRHWIASVVSQQVGQANVNGTKLKNCAVPLPPEQEQVRILDDVAQHSSVIDALLASCLHDLARCGRLRQSILKWAFEGKLTDSDPTDEPASTLLERLRSERAAASNNGGAPRTRRKKATKKKARK